MTEQEYEETKSAINGAQEETTHIIDERYYSNDLLPDLNANRGTVWSVWYSDDFMEMWEYLTEDSIQMYRDIRAINDLRTMVEQYEENKRLKAKVAELEKIVKQAQLNIATEISSHVEGLSSAKDIRVAVDKIQAYYYEQAKQLKEQEHE